MNISKSFNEYQPDAPSPPGETLLEILETLNMSQAELASRMGRPRKTINEIIKGKVTITPETALQLELVLNIPATFWTNREKQYQEALARSSQRKLLEKEMDWLDKKLYKEMVAFGWIEERVDNLEKLEEMLRFFGVASPSDWERIWVNNTKVAFHQSKIESKEKVVLSAWIRRGEITARNIRCEPFDEHKFRKALKEIRSLTTQPPTYELYFSKIKELCQEAGVAFTITRRLPKMNIFGASQWLTPQKPFIQQSLYYKADDYFWFTFFHEAAHILLHSKKAIHINENLKVNNVKENEANKFAADFLIPPKEYDAFIDSERENISNEKFTYESIIDFANHIGIAASIVVGRLQRERKIDYYNRTKLKTRFKWLENGELEITPPTYSN